MAANSTLERHGAYAVPQRFGISAILALTTLFACVFAILKGFEAHPVFYLYFGTLGVSICLAQMFFDRVPRVCSIVAGALLLPFWVFVTAIFYDPPTMVMYYTMDYILRNSAITAPLTLVCGGFIGYLAGAVMAGFFLLLDMVQAPSATERASPPDVHQPLAADAVGPSEE